MADRGQVIDVQIGILRSDVRLEVPASEDSLPLVRQALRSIGETVDADVELLEDAELAVTEALANAVEHAYSHEDGEIRVSFTPSEEEILVSVRDFGRGLDVSEVRAGAGAGFGLSMIESLARRVEIRGTDGTEVEMAFGLGSATPVTVDGAVPGVQPAERILRRIVAVAAAQMDMSVERLMEALLVVELTARHGIRYLVGEQVEFRLTLGDDALDLRVGPLEVGGAEHVILDSDVPVVGSVVERLADDWRVEAARAEGIDCEYIVLRLAAAA